MNLDLILKLGDPLLYEPSSPVQKEELPALQSKIDVLNELILEFRKTYGLGRGIAAPQIGLMKRIICLNLAGKRYTIINPELSELSEERFELWDDCMCFPNLFVKVSRHQSCRLTYLDENWEQQSWLLDGALSELIQHEYDHLEGILATQRAIDDRSFKVKGS